MPERDSIFKRILGGRGTRQSSIESSPTDQVFDQKQPERTGLIRPSQDTVNRWYDSLPKLTPEEIKAGREELLELVDEVLDHRPRQPRLPGDF